MNIFELAKSVDIADVISQYMDLHGPQQGHYLGLCPFHGDKHLGSFKVTPGKGMFKCWSCGVQGDGIDFVSQYLNVSPLEAAVQICETHGLISSLMAKKILGGELSHTEVLPLRTPKKKVEPLLAKRRSMDDLDLCYTAFVNAAGHVLSKAFVETLTEERHLNPDELADYFVWPRNTDKFWSAFRDQLAAQGVKSPSDQQDFLLGIPGFYLGNDNTLTFVTSRKSALGIPVRNRDGKLAGLQLRQMEPIAEGESRYRFMSSGFANGCGKARGKYGCGCGYVENVEYPRRPWCRTIALTEGHFKAVTLAKLGFLVVNMHGISNWRPAGDVALELAQKYPHTIRYLLVFDSEETKPVYQSRQGLAEKLKAARGDIAVEAAVWNSQYGKGIDDVINAGYQNKISRIKL